MNRKLAQSLGIGAALLVPALVLAQALPPSFPAGFGQNDVLTAPALDAMRQEIVNLRGRVAALEGRSNSQGVGTIRNEDTFANGADGTRTYGVTGHGLLIVRAAGSNFGSADIDVSVQGATVGRAREGTATLVPVRAGDVVSVEVANFAAPAAGSTNNVGVFLFPLSAAADLVPR